ncbi:MAG: glycosyltransferase family 2 protein [Pseudomonadales bacterium]
MTRISISIVTFRSDETLLGKTLLSLCRATQQAMRVIPGLTSELHLIENDTVESASLHQVKQLLETGRLATFTDVQLHASSKNLGFGGGHNQIIADLNSDVHLILNPDVELAENSIETALNFFSGHENIGLLCPYAVSPNGSALHLCKRYPSVLDLFIRGFVPTRLQGVFQRRLARYEMHELISSPNPQPEIKIVSGCCMFIRTSLLQTLRGFDERFFLYFEDFDLSLRATQVSSLAYLPSVKIVHHGGDAAKKGVQHIRLFIRSAVTFYKTHGWRWT